MTINIEKKHIVVGAIIVGVIIAAIIGAGAIKNAAYMKRAKNCQREIHNLYYVSSLMASELHDVWSDYIFEDKEYIDRNTGRFYKYTWNAPDSADVHYCSNFSRAIAEKSDYYEKQGLNDIMDSLYTSVKQLMTKMTPAPKKYSEIHSSINALFHTTEAMYNCASSPEGNLRSYTEQINSLSADYKKQESQVDIEIGELKKEEYKDFELEVLLKLLWLYSAMVGGIWFKWRYSFGYSKSFESSILARVQ